MHYASSGLDTGLLTSTSARPCRDRQSLTEAPPVTSAVSDRGPSCTSAVSDRGPPGTRAVSDRGPSCHQRVWLSRRTSSSQRSAGVASSAPWRTAGSRRSPSSRGPSGGRRQWLMVNTGALPSTPSPPGGTTVDVSRPYSPMPKYPAIVDPKQITRTVTHIIIMIFFLRAPRWYLSAFLVSSMALPT